MQRLILESEMVSVATFETSEGDGLAISLHGIGISYLRRTDARKLATALGKWAIAQNMGDTAEIMKGDRG